jgi:hypothetical protein
MKAGRNDPCPCGSGKKYKKCCLPRDQEETARQMAAVIPPPPSPSPSPVASPRPAPRVAEAPAPAPPPPPDPIAERADSIWQEFESQQDGGGRLAVFLRTLEDAEVMTDDMAFEMLDVLHGDAVESGSLLRFAEYVGALRERRPEVFAEGAHFYLDWLLRDALAEGRQEVVPSLARELAETAGRNLDIFDHAATVLGYHGQLDVLVEAFRIAWPQVKSSEDVLPWAISEFANKGADHEIFDYLERTAAPDPADPALLDRVKFFVEEPREEYLREFLADLMGTSGREWQTEDFDLTRKRPRKRRRDDRGDEEDESQTPAQGKDNLFRLISEFAGYLRREHGVPFPRGNIVRRELYEYFMRRHKGDLDPRPGMLDQALHPKKKLPKPPRPAHPLCPERVTLDVHLGQMMGMLSGQYHAAAALFQAMPAWLRFLESRRLIDAATNRDVVTELLPLHATLLQLWEKLTDDPLLYRQGQAWPAPALP